MDKGKIKFTLEYPINSTVASLYAKLSSEGGLESWFADRVTQNEGRFTFYWHKIPQEAMVVGKKENKYVRFKWSDDEDLDYYFEFSIAPAELTREIVLSVTDFAEEEEYEDALHLWENNIKKLKMTLGVGN